MRNLRNVAFDSTPLPSGLPLTAKAWDTNQNAVICSFGPTNDQAVIELKRRKSYNQNFETIASWDAPCPLPSLECDEVLLLQHFADIATTCLILAGGDIVVVREEPVADQERIEIVGSVDVGIAAAAWAPDEELLAIVTREDSLVLMSREFEPVTETMLSSEDLQASKHVSVGWGKKETQFQGKRARTLRDPTVPVSVDEGKMSPLDDNAVSIGWRGDGRYFAVNSVVPHHRRVIRVFSREAILDSASEPVDGLESALSWRPHGNLLAGIKRSAEKVEVVFFERNGLRHGDFDLRISPDEKEIWAKSISLSWNMDSTVLAVGFGDRLQLWTLGNYHYYLKQELVLSPAKSTTGRRPVITPLWHAETPLRFQICDQNRHLDLTYHHTVCRGPVIPGRDYGAVAVIDGKILKLTPLRQAGVPPPMSFYEISFEHNITDCAFSADGLKVAALTTKTLEVCSWEIKQGSGSRSSSSNTRFCTSLSEEPSRLDLPGLSTAVQSTCTQVVLCDQAALVLVPSQNNRPASIQKALLPQLSEWHCVEVSLHLTGQNLVTDVKGDRFAIQGSDGKLTLLEEGGEETFDQASTIIPESAASDAVLFQTPYTINSTAEVETNGDRFMAHVASLSPKGTLKVDSTTLARDCTSFLVTDAHLIFTTSQHLLKFVHLIKPSHMEVPGNTPEVDERCRSIERGAKIVTVMPSAYAVVLQMPRGNLETIYPRVLVLAGIRKHINDLDYRAGFLACQSQQVDMNILHDYEPFAFIDNVHSFIEQLKKPSRIDEFISKLKEEDVTQTLYRDTLKLAREHHSALNDLSAAAKVEKVNRICDAFITALQKYPSTPGYTQNVITAHVCKRPPDLDAALSLVSRLHGVSPSEADLAISHLCFLTDTSRLYNAALALYDLEVTLLVAQNAQRDPREYMPFLQELHSMPDLKRQYTIDNHLKNYSRALTSLHAMNDFAAVEEYTLKHSLFSHALSLYKYSPDHHASISQHYAAYLASTNSPLQAAILYDSFGQYELAYPLYGLAHAWREALTCATLAGIPDAQLTTLAAGLATTLTDENRDYRSAAYVHEHYLSSPLEAARLLCRGSYFAEALLLLSRTDRDAISAIIDPGLGTQLASILSLLSDVRSQAKSQSTRLAELRNIKAADPLAFYGGDPTNLPPGVDIPDNISLAPTDLTTTTFANGSLFTRAGAGSNSRFGGTQLSTASRKTSKTKRKEERKRARGKKGSVYEEEYLVNSLRRLIERWNGVHDEVKRLLAGLGRRGRREEGVSVLEGMKDVEVLLVQIKEELWPNPEMMNDDRAVRGASGESADGPPTRPNGADGVLWDAQLETEGGVSKVAPDLKSWRGDEVFL